MSGNEVAEQIKEDGNYSNLTELARQLECNYPNPSDLPYLIAASLIDINANLKAIKENTEPQS